MKVHHSLICFFLLSLINAEILHHKGTEGGNITVACSFTFSGNGRKFFCKGECKEENILIETTGVRAQRGRYSIEYKEGIFLLVSRTLYVSISQLTKSDSGRYRCGLDRTLFPDGFSDFHISVTDAPSISNPDGTSVPSASTPPSAQSFTPSSSSPETTEQSDQQQTETPAAPAHSGVLLYVGLVLTIMVILFSLALLIFCRKRTNNPKDRPADTEYTSVKEANRVYEEVSEDRQSRSPPEVSSVYVYAKYTKPTDTTNTYSLATAASSQHKAEDDLSKPIYSQLSFSNGAATSHSATSGHANDVIYSVPQVQESCDGSQAENSSPPLYSVASKQ